MKISVAVKTGSSQGDKLIVEPDGSYTAVLRARPIDGAANVALIKLLSEFFGVSKSKIIIKSGVTSKHKIVEIDTL